MFTDNESKMLIARLTAILEEQKAGKAEGRKEIAELLVNDVREYLAGRYNAKPQTAKDIGIHQLRDVVEKEDFGR